ncbi:MAG: hypothetical protein D6689_12285 [Deltaproteobacteria bacterium]|nr:MAG: hypothetical protein D6689_12285 [Deltaproteobacteria bacterium]
MRSRPLAALLSPSACRGVAAALAAALAACAGDAGPTADAGAGPSAALFEVPRAGGPPPSGFYALPFPNDIRAGDDGRIDLADYVRPNALIDNYIEAIAAEQRFFSVNAPVFFRFTAPIDPASLPADPAAAAADGASVYLVDVDPDSPERGERRPLRFRFEHYPGETIGADWLAVLPYPGFVLRERTTYAAVVTRRVRAADGSPVARPPDLDAILADAAPADPDLARAHRLYAPLRAWLDEPGGDERADVASAAVFTTADVTGPMTRLRQAALAVAPPALRDLARVDERTDFYLYDAAYDAPNFQAGDVPYIPDGGAIVTDPATGLPAVQRMEPMRVAFAIPKGTPPADGWPIVLYAHGTGGDYHTFVRNGVAAELTRRGLAVAGIDQVLHGPRNPGTSPEIAFFNLQNPQAARNNTLQGAVDNVTLLRLVTAVDVADGDAILRFDAGRAMFFGHSQGGLTGPPWLAVEPSVRGAVLSGAGGLLYLSLLHKTEPVNIPDLLAVLIRDVPLDEFNPVLAMLQMWLDGSDPASYARLLVREPPQGGDAKSIFQSEGLPDRFTPNPAIRAFAVAMAIPPIEPVIEPIDGLALRGLTPLAPPVAGNAGGATAGLLQYDEVPGSDGHFVVFDREDARRQSAEFLATLAADGVATIVAP